MSGTATRRGAARARASLAFVIVTYAYGGRPPRFLSVACHIQANRAQTKNQPGVQKRAGGEAQVEEIASLLGGFAVVLTPFNIGLMLVGILLGVIIGVLPGLGGANGVA